MRTSVIKLFLISTIMALHFSCNHMTPAGFWANYQSEFIQINENDQGPWGGKRKIIWRHENTTFNKADVIKYALNNSWYLTDSVLVVNDSIKLLTVGYNGDYSYKILKKKVIPFLDPTKKYDIFVFTTGWITVQPGNDSETEKNGFIIHRKDSTELIVYHLWGE